MRAPQTLRARLVLSATVATAGAVLAITALAAVVLERRLHAEQLNVLRSRAEATADTITVRPDGSLELTDNDRGTALDGGIWVFEGRTPVERPVGPEDLQQVALGLAGTSGRVVRRDGSPASAFLSRAVPLTGPQVGTVVAAISLDPYVRSERETAVGALLVAVLVVAVVALVARQLAGRALTPVTAMTQQAGRWSEDATDSRFGPGDRPAELAELAGTLDAVLDRQAAVLRREQRLSAEISHELRTPLAGILAETELFAARPRSAQEAARAMTVVQDGARRMERILDTLLAAARADAAPSLGRCDPVAVARATGLPVAVEGAVPSAGIDGEVLERVLAPLVDNAARWAAREVRLVVRAVPGAVVVEVLDDGPGVPADAVEAVFEPGRRLVPDDGHDGAGLGLALARRLARSAGGDLTAAPGPGGRFTVRLPRA